MVTLSFAMLVGIGTWADPVGVPFGCAIPWSCLSLLVTVHLARVWGAAVVRYGN